MRCLKAPATLVGGAVSQVLYPKLATTDRAAARLSVRQVMGVLLAMALPLVLVLMVFGPALFAALFGEPWREAGELARALAPYIGVHFVASPLAVVTLAWQAQGWALRLALIGQAVFLAAVAVGLHFGGLQGAAWAVSAAMLPYFGFYFWSLAHWPLPAPEPNASTHPT
jgi:O-antigen/teichoic acid export membrane protein